MILLNDIARCYGIDCDKRYECERFIQSRSGRVFLQPPPLPSVTCTAQIKAKAISKKTDK